MTTYAALLRGINLGSHAKIGMPALRQVFLDLGHTDVQTYLQLKKGAYRFGVSSDDGFKLLAGRAKFDVAHDALRPFSVLARNRLTVATGTSFSVELLSRQVLAFRCHGREAGPCRSDRDLLADRGGSAGRGGWGGRRLHVPRNRPR